MHFSEHFRVTRTTEDDWFDPILDTDTPVFVDPFLLFRRGVGNFAAGHECLIAFFRTVFGVAAQSGGKPTSPAFRKLHNLLLFPEVDELCLGYVAGGVKGSGTAKTFGKHMAAAVLRAISDGLVRFEHFEEIGIFNLGIGPDRISDITGNVLKELFITYTQHVCERHNIPTEPLPIQHAGLDLDLLIWREEVYDLPRNPHTKDALLLTPAVFLRQLPTINATSFWQYVCDTRDPEALRSDLNFEIMRHLDKKAIIEVARTHPQWVEEYVSFAERNLDPEPYDLTKDRAGIVGWDKPSRAFAQSNPVELVASTEEEFFAALEVLLRQYKHFVEENNGYKLLWNDDGTPKPEDAAQLLFMGIAKQYCRANNIDVSKEANLGRGPVDFKFSTGYAKRALLEVKLARNTRFWHGLQKQLPKYLTVEEITRGYFQVICHTTEELTEKLAPIESVVARAAAATGLQLICQVIDATKAKRSASKVE